MTLWASSEYLQGEDVILPVPRARRCETLIGLKSETISLTKQIRALERTQIMATQRTCRQVVYQVRAYTS